MNKALFFVPTAALAASLLGCPVDEGNDDDVSQAEISDAAQAETSDAAHEAGDASLDGVTDSANVTDPPDVATQPIDVRHDAASDASEDDAGPDTDIDGDPCADAGEACETPSTWSCANGTLRFCTTVQDCLVWDPRSECPSGFCRDALACGNCPTQSCDVGETWCDGGDLRTCGTDTNGCIVWGQGIPCASDVCGDRYSCAPCQDRCALGTTRCNVGTLQRCETQPDSCAAWVDIEACETGTCADGLACGACSDTCPILGASMCEDGAMRTCQGTATGCLAWSAPVPCALGCADEACATCTTTTPLTVQTLSVPTLHPRGVALEGDYAFVVGNYGGTHPPKAPMYVVNLAATHDTGTSANFATHAIDIEISHSRAYVAATGDGLVVFDLSTPTAPVETSRFPLSGQPYRLALSGDTLLVASRQDRDDMGGALTYVDISQPTPGSSASVAMQGSALDVAVNNAIAHVVDDQVGVRLYDLTAPTTEIALLPTGVGTRAVALEDNLAAVVTNRGSGGGELFVYDVSTPATPTLLQQITVPNDTFPTGLAFEQERLLMFSGSGTQVYVDVALHPRAIDQLGFTFVWDMARTPERLVTVTEADFIQSWPLDSVFSRVSNIAPRSSLADTIAIEARGNILFAVDDNHGLLAYAVLGDDSAILVSDTPLDEPPFALDLQGRYAYVLMESTNLDAPFLRLEVFDVFDASAPRSLGHLDIDTYGSALSLGVHRDVAYIGASVLGTVLVDVSDPRAPTLVNSTLGGPIGLNASAFDGDLAFLARGSVQIHDISDIGDPTHLATTNWRDPVALAVWRDTLFAAARFSVWQSDVTDPASPGDPVHFLGGESNQTATGLTVAPPLLLRSHEHTGLMAIDVSTPGAFGGRQLFGIPGGARGAAAVVGNKAYVPAGAIGIQAITLCRP